MAANPSPVELLTRAALIAAQVRQASKDAAQQHYTQPATAPAPGSTATPTPGPGGR